MAARRTRGPLAHDALLSVPWHRSRFSNPYMDLVKRLADPGTVSGKLLQEAAGFDATELVSVCMGRRCTGGPR